MLFTFGVISRAPLLGFILIVIFDEARIPFSYAVQVLFGFVTLKLLPFKHLPVKVVIVDVNEILNHVIHL